MPARNRIVVLGAHVLDTIVHPVQSIPEGQGAQVVDSIVISAAGTAAGTGIVLSKLGAEVVSVGAIGNDPAGWILKRLLTERGIDVTHLTETDLPTSASVLPIRPDGSRPALHMIGANVLAAEAVPWDVIARSSHLHIGAPEMMGPEAVLELLAFAQEKGVSTSIDCLVGGQPEYFGLIEPLLGSVDYLLPNSEQAMGWTGEADIAAAARSLISCGAACVVITDGASPVVLARGEDLTLVPTLDAQRVVDTSGAGDAFSAGFIQGRLVGLDHVQSVRLGCAAAAQVVSGIGTDFGDFDLDGVMADAEAAAGERSEPWTEAR